MVKELRGTCRVQPKGLLPVTSVACHHQRLSPLLIQYPSPKPGALMFMTQMPSDGGRAITRIPRHIDHMRKIPIQTSTLIQLITTQVFLLVQVCSSPIVSRYHDLFYSR